MASDLRVGRYRLIRKLAAGGMAEVWLASHAAETGFTKRLVVKKILPHLAGDRAFVAMFHEEARLMSVLTHPNVVQAFELGEERGVPYLVLEYVAGGSVKDLIRHHRATRTLPDPWLCARLIADVAAGLQHVHTVKAADGSPLQLIHRDVSPDNILVSYDGHVKLSDFGVARANLGESRTGTGVLKGKVSYMAPERMKLEPFDSRVDVYSLGVVMYELLSIQRPFGKGTPEEMMGRVMSATPVPLSQACPQVPAELAAVVARAMERQPDDRYPTARQLADALQALLSKRPAGTTELAPWVKGALPEELATQDLEVALATAVSRGAPKPGRRRALLVVGLLLFAVGATVGVLQRPAVIAPAVVPPALAAELPAETPDSGPAVAGAAASTPLAADAGAVALAERAAPPPSVKPADRRRRRASNAAAGSTLPGTLTVRVHPWGDVIVDAKVMGMTPLAPISLAPGRHSVTVLNSKLGKRVSRSVVIRAGADEVIEFKLTAP